MFKTVDLVEPVGMLLDKAKETLTGKNVGDFHLLGLQDFTPKPAQYDIIWVQWVIGHLTDDDFIAFFKRCQKVWCIVSLCVCRAPARFFGIMPKMTLFV